MQNNNPSHDLQKDELDLKEIFKLLINSKILIITITLVITILSTIYFFQKTPVYHSAAILEIGSFDIATYNSDSQFAEHESKLIESSKDLIQNLTIHFIHKQQENVLFHSIDNRLIRISRKSNNLEINIELINKVIGYIENRHATLLQKIENQLKYEIDQINIEIDFIANSLLTQNEQQKLNQESINLRTFQLSKGLQRLQRLEFLMKQYSTKTKLIRVWTDKIQIKKRGIIFLGFLFGLSLSIVMVFIKNSLKAIKE